MNPSKDFEQINFNPFNFFNDHDQQDTRDPDLNYFNDLDSNNFDSVTVEKEIKNSKNLIITCCYRPPGGAIKGLNSFLGNVFKKANTGNKLCFVAGDFNLNCSDYNKNLEN